MAWLKIDDGFVENEKIAGLSDRAFRLHVAALCYCARNLTDGFVSDRAVKSLSIILGIKSPRRVTELVTGALWTRSTATQSGYIINDYLDYNPSSEKVKTGRKLAAERQRVRRALTSHAVTNAGSHASPSRPVNTRSRSCPDCGLRFQGPRTLLEHRYVAHNTVPDPDLAASA